MEIPKHIQLRIDALNQNTKAIREARGRGRSVGFDPQNSVSADDLPLETEEFNLGKVTKLVDKELVETSVYARSVLMPDGSIMLIAGKRGERVDPADRKRLLDSGLNKQAAAIIRRA